MNTFIENKIAEFDDLFCPEVGAGKTQFDRFETKRDFLKEALLEQQEQIVNIIQGNYKGSFTDDGGNDCWYVDDLVSIIKDLKN